jgi:hypothetical protein
MATLSLQVARAENPRRESAENVSLAQHSLASDAEEDCERRGSLQFITTRRGSRLSDIMQFQEKRKRNKARYKDNQGFTWRKFVRDEEPELPVPRAPKPQLPAPRLPSPIPSPISPSPALPTQQSPSRTDRARMKRTPVERSPPSVILTEQFSTPPSTRDPDTVSIRSDISFKTASSDPQLNLIPRQISDSYKHAPTPESAATERKTSVRLLQQQQYSALSAVNNNGATVPVKQARTPSKSVR